MVEDPSVSELNLYLYDDQESLKDATNTDDNGTASLLVPADGHYFVRVEAADYASLATATVYVLSIGHEYSSVRPQYVLSIDHGCSSVRTQYVLSMDHGCSSVRPQYVINMDHGFSMDALSTTSVLPSHDGRLS